MKETVCRRQTLLYCPRLCRMFLTVAAALAVVGAPPTLVEVAVDVDLCRLGMILLVSYGVGLHCVQPEPYWRMRYLL